MFRALEPRPKIWHSLGAPRKLYPQLPDIHDRHSLENTAALSVQIRTHKTKHPEYSESSPLLLSIPPPTRVLIVDDHRVVRDGVRRYLQSYDGIEVIGTASDGEEAVGLVADLKPTIVLMDIDMPKMNGVDATRRISKISPSTRVLAFTAHHRAPLTRDMVKAGVWGVIDKGSCGPEEIAAAIARVEEGERIIPPELEAAALEADSGETPELSPREREVLLLIADGLTSKAIGEKLGIGLRTVETYRERLTNKLGIQGTVGLTKWAISRGLLKAEQ